MPAVYLVGLVCSVYIWLSIHELEVNMERGRAASPSLPLYDGVMLYRQRPLHPQRLERPERESEIEAGRALEHASNTLHWLGILTIQRSFLTISRAVVSSSESHTSSVILRDDP